MKYTREKVATGLSRVTQGYRQWTLEYDQDNSLGDINCNEKNGFFIILFARGKCEEGHKNIILNGKSDEKLTKQFLKDIATSIIHATINGYDPNKHQFLPDWIERLNWGSFLKKNNNKQ